jgi:hypothetical protein
MAQQNLTKNQNISKNNQNFESILNKYKQKENKAK